MVSAKEAKKILEDMKQRSRDRQREFTQRQRAEGKQRIFAWITKEAYDALVKYRKDTRLENGEIVSEALLLLTQGGHEQTPAKRMQPVSKSATPPGPKADRAEAIQRIAEMVRQGHGFKTIAKVFNDDGYPTISGRGQWPDSTVKKLHDEGKRTGVISD